MERTIAFDAPRPVKLTVADFMVLDHAGALAAHRRAQLIDGGITEMSPMGLRPALVLTTMLVRLHDALRRTESGLVALTAPTIAIPPHDAPEPDITVARPVAGDGYIDRRDVALVVEISVSTLRYDLSSKRALYARAGLPEYWVVDVAAAQVHQFWSPEAGDYAQTRAVPLAGTLRSATLPDLAIDGGGMLP